MFQMIPEIIYLPDCQAVPQKHLGETLRSTKLLEAVILAVLYETYCVIKLIYGKMVPDHLK